MDAAGYVRVHVRFSFDSAYAPILMGHGLMRCCCFCLSDSSARWGWRQWLHCSGLAFSKEDSLWYELFIWRLTFSTRKQNIQCSIFFFRQERLFIALHCCLILLSGWEMRWGWTSNVNSVCRAFSGLASNSNDRILLLVTIFEVESNSCIVNYVFQYLKNVQIRDIPILERFSLFICIALVWAYAQILTAGGAYKHSPEVTQINCRTDRANLISSAPWFVSAYFPIEFVISLMCQVN